MSVEASGDYGSGRFTLNPASDNMGERRVTLRQCRGLYWRQLGGSSSAVERQLPKLDVTGSIPVSRSIFFSLQRSRALLSQSIKRLDSRGCACYFPLAWGVWGKIGVYARPVLQESRSSR